MKKWISGCWAMALAAHAALGAGLPADVEADARAAMAKGAAWLAAQQQADGHWAIADSPALTGLSMWALQKADPAAYKAVIDRAMVFVLTSVQEETHVLGLLMVEALFALEGAQCVPLGPQMPLLDIARAAAAHRADIVALSFSAAFPARRIPPVLKQVRGVLPTDVALWSGGEGMQQVIPPEGVKRLLSLASGLDALNAWTVSASGIG